MIDPARKPFAGVAVLLLMANASAVACPVCNTATGAQVRETLLDDDIVINISAVVLPFIVAGAAVAGVGLLPARGRRNG